MRVGIFGGCGFVGRRFVKRFLDLGHEVTVVDNLSTGQTPDVWMFKPNSNKKAKFLFCDARTYFNTAKAAWFDLVIHLAAVVGGRLKIENDPLAVATDLSIDAEMFNWAVKVDSFKDEKMPRVIYFSSSAVYPVELQTEGKNLALYESLQGFASTRIGMPDMTYGWSKLSGEYLAKFAHEKYGLDVKIYRPFGGYGEDQDMSYPFPAIIKRVLDGNDPVIVWGSGQQKRDFIHIEDVVSAVMESMDSLPACQPLNLGTGKATSFYELAGIAGDVLGKEFKIRNDSTKPEGVFSRVADIARMQKWYTPATSLRDGIKLVADAIESRQAKVQAAE